jgi:RHH-type proline utilization regulon transcriptional repressor/proline dehydrogenase/delta 1-pyrroline-5-carboxylate dehydrogenase
VGEHLIGHDAIDAIILTGAYETARLFARLAPRTPMFAETSGKNAIVVLPDADLDLAVADLVRSAFGHAGQKCSAASLAICVGEVATSTRFRRQLVDAARTLVVGDARRPESVMGPLIEAPSDKLRRALTTLDAGQRWLLEPQLLDAATDLWSPGILDGVDAGSWFHQTECFGPVLGLMAATDLDAALALQNGVAYGLTGGIHTLDPAKAAQWLERVEVGNAYVNRAITGAIVQRQPFGGWKRSVVGPGAKAGGPSYVAQLGRWSTTGRPQLGQEPSPAVAARLRSLLDGLDGAERERIEAAVRSDARVWAEELTVDHDPTGLFCEANVLRYRPLRHLVVRVAADAPPMDVARVLCAVALAAPGTDVSVAPDHPAPLTGVDHRRETTTELARRLSAAVRAPDRVRLVGGDDLIAADVPGDTYLDARPPVDDGRIELARYVREQAVSRTLHRFGNLTTVTPSGGPPGRRASAGPGRSSSR